MPFPWKKSKIRLEHSYVEALHINANTQISEYLRQVTGRRNILHM